MSGLTTVEYAALDGEQRAQALSDAFRELENAQYTLARYKVAEAAGLIRQEFPEARWVAFEQGHDGLDASTIIHRVYGDGEQAVLFDLEEDEDGEFPNTAAEDYLSGAGEGGFDFRERGDLLWLDLIELR
ncbi:hypothetical protein [Micromonospora sp. NPDC047730]|uniref:hypothetical protein n=1 Tax=Micromonospora sp. NPDC047730 TaxID=3364253 RepID=UPI0037126897